MDVPTCVMSIPNVATPFVMAPPRGRVLCVISDEQLRDALEGMFVRQGYVLFRARDVWHASLLAASTLPEVIVAEIPSWSSLGSELFDALRRNKATAHIPVLALVDSAIQDRPGVSAYRSAAAVMLKTATLDEIQQRIDEIASQKSPRPEFRRIDPAIETVDAVFSEFGMRRSTLSAKRGSKHRVDASSTSSASEKAKPLGRRELGDRSWELGVGR